MFSKPSAGWCTFSIQNYEFQFSYLEDTPQHFIDQLKNALDNRTTFSIWMDGEGPFCMLASDRYFLYVIDDLETQFGKSSELSCYSFQIDMSSFVQEFIHDMEMFKEDFSHWCICIEDGGCKEYDLSDLKQSLKKYLTK